VSKLVKTARCRFLFRWAQTVAEM